MIENQSNNIDNKEILAKPGQTILQAAMDQDIYIPYLCYYPKMKPQGSCRACMVEIQGERVLAASCIRKPTPGMVVNVSGERPRKARASVLELLLSDQPEINKAHDKSSKLWKLANEQGIQNNRFPKIETEKVPILDSSHVAMSVNLDACIQCNLCVRACREVQVNDVIGMAGRGRNSKIVFDQDDPMGDSSCVACGECVQACPTGALMPSNSVDKNQVGNSEDYDSETTSVCPFCGVGCQINIKVKNGKIKNVDGGLGPANEQRLCVKVRFGFDYIHNEGRLKKPLIRKNNVKKEPIEDYANLKVSDYFREASWDEVIKLSSMKLKNIYESFGPSSICGFGSAKGSNEEAYLFQKLIRTAFQTNNVDHCTRLCHASSVAALMAQARTRRKHILLRTVVRRSSVYLIRLFNQVALSPPG